VRRGTTVVALVALAALAGACATKPGVAVKGHTTIDPNGTTPVDGTTPADGSGGTAGTAGSISWGTCNDPKVTEDTLQCATLDVPLDYSKPDDTSKANTLTLALVRVPATGTRKGAVLFNPGGPGGSGFDPIAESGTSIQGELGLSHYDVVGFDPRGVDRSGGIRCVDDAFVERHLYLDDTPDTPEAQALLDEASSGFTKGCKDRYGTTLQYYSTANTARDMDRIRAGLGDQQIGFLGISYGTYLGAVYATLFPDRVRSMALDSAFEPNGDTVEQQFLTQTVGFEGAFNDWAAWCKGTSECAFKSPDVGARWDALRKQLDDHPLTSTTNRTVNQATMDTATSAALYSRGDWPVLGEALAKAEQGDGDAMLSLADSYEGRNEDGTFDTLFQSIGIIECASGIDQKPPTEAEAEAIVKKIKEQAPRMGGTVTAKDLVNQTSSCTDLMPAQTPVALKYEGKGPIVVVGGTKDPATPIRWAEEMTKELGPQTRMVTFDGEGHGQLLASKCITKIEGAVLASQKLPAENTTCQPDPVVPKPSWWGDLPMFPNATTADLPAVLAAVGLTDTLGYGQAYVSDDSETVADTTFTDALTAAGFRDLGAQDIGLAHTTDRVWQAPNGDVMVVLGLGAAAFDDPELSSAKGAVPAGKTVVVVAYVPQ
jgi:pimeloyl-ACP methyl ester carboxylesterase